MTQSGEKITVLYIDDSAVEREIVCQLLEAEGCRVMATGVPEQGIKLACETAPDLILLDLHMPGMDGCAVVDRLREVPELKEVPIVALSASIREEEREEVYARFDGFLKKPVDVEAFPREVRGYMSRGRGGEVPSGKEGESGSGGSDDLPGDVRVALETLEKIRSAMSHDLRSPLTVMISYASTVGREKAGSLSERQKEMLELVVEQGFKMDKLIAELVSIARETLDEYGY
ncbi:MAG: response regulator [Actinobacteria bacterium]|nr:response regulator [Actinomycetota bacterium]